MPEPRPYLIKFAPGGDAVYLTGGSKRQGYGNPESPHAAEEFVNIPGIPVVDFSKIPKKIMALVIAQPMVGEKDEPCPRESLDSDMMTSIARQDPTMRITLEVQRRNMSWPGPLDVVRPETFVQWWRERGARIGVTTENGIVWEGSR